MRPIFAAITREARDSCTTASYRGVSRYRVRQAHKAIGRAFGSPSHGPMPIVTPSVSARRLRSASMQALLILLSECPYSDFSNLTLRHISAGLSRGPYSNRYTCWVEVERWGPRSPETQHPSSTFSRAFSPAFLAGACGMQRVPLPSTGIFLVLPSVSVSRSLPDSYHCG